MALFNATQQHQIASAYILLTRGTAYETPFAEDVIERVAPVAVSSGFMASTGAFYEAAKLNPISTLLKWINYLGSK
jgi:hypothetical protein